MTEFKVCIASYARAGRVTTHKLFEPGVALIVVPEKQRRAYVNRYGTDSVLVVADTEDGGISKKRNAILNRFDNVLILDDDITAIGMYEDGQRLNPKGAQLLSILARYFDLAAQIGVTLWGINQNNDALIYDTYRPFNLLAPILGPFGAHLKPSVRYDPSVKGKEDFDFWLRTIHRHRQTLRVNKMYYNHDHAKKAGGFTSMRTMATEESDMAILRRRYGKIITFGGSSGGGRFGTDILNSEVEIPIPGC